MAETAHLGEETLPASAAQVFFRLTDRLFRATETSDVYEAALDAIFDTLHCDRASILMFDDQGVMRFVASRGLSAGYIEAVTGHTPWRPGEKQPEPISVTDIDNANESDQVKTIIRGEGIRALAFVPLVAHGGVVGKFMVYHDAPHQFSSIELDVARAIAHQVAFSLERDIARGLRGRVEQASQLLGSIVENSNDAIISKDLGGIINTWNKGAERLFGYAPDEIIGRSVLTLIPTELQHEEPGIIERIGRGERIEHFETERVRKNGERVFISLTVSPVKDASGVIVGASKIARDITERKRADEQRQLLINELNHRVKNTLATVQSLVMQTLRNTERSADARSLIDARLTALARAHDLLTAENWEGAYLREVVERALMAFTAGARVEVGGPVVRLTPKQALALSIALHELATNAAKYGALSNEAGRVALKWELRGEMGNQVLHLNWRESGGPSVSPPTRVGFGSRLIERNLAYELGGEARIDYLPEGVEANISTPVERRAVYQWEG
ncbi:MAG TPA: PAS domain S-box protein [Verrucomicrobiae bacterium]|nr:PAS domain S-box protein [Verrucomicrobiae bacterium]